MKILPLFPLLFALLLTGCGAKAVTLTTENATTKNQSMSNIPLFMVPVNHDVAKRQKPPSFDELFKAVAEDKECQALAKRLFWGAPVELVSVKGEQAEDAIPAETLEQAKKGPSFVYIRFRADAFPMESTENVIVGMYSYRRLSRRLLDKVEPLTEKTMEDAFDDADDFEVLLLLCNDYLFRHGSDWIVIGKAPHTKEALEKSKFELEEVKKNHVERIETFLQKYGKGR